MIWQYIKWGSQYQNENPVAVFCAALEHCVDSVYQYQHAQKLQ